ncbi:M56 family metallopeptidase [Cognataquiflexum rubidum]|uniref:M56 family metallopeptidase n=1 Tax=Cognataquiflexum rubidum TaxID=2922273 RepID=UPI001F1432D4|nr:M56 family metallopeptidase [Cognataquiflexum rubidum]MCH6232435.1 M56 family metallopeptidase [Cognataquiflexum rubidum]
MALYFIKSAVCLLLLLLFHRLVLQKEAMYHFNRFYLLFSVVVSFLIPLNTIEVATTQPLFEPEVPTEFVPAVESLGMQPVVSNAEKSLDWKLVLILFYGLITFALLVRFIRNINILFEKVNRNVLIKYRGENLVMLHEDCPPFSFLKYIFVSHTDFEAEKFTDAILIHESTHVKEKHSWDNLLVEFLLVFFWFHPGLYWVKTAIKLNHEFIADQAALKIIPIEKYKLELLSMVLTGQNFGLASSLNFSLTKKRLEMMKHNTTNSTKWIKIIALVPVLGALVYILSEKVSAQNKDQIPQTLYYDVKPDRNTEDFDIILTLFANGEVEIGNKIYTISQAVKVINEIPKKKTKPKARLTVKPETPMGFVSDLQYALFDNGIKHIDHIQLEQKAKPQTLSQSSKKDFYYQNSTFYIQDKNGNKTKKMYSELTENEKSELREPPSVPVKASPSSETFEGWKDPKKFALWLDDLIIPNTKLDGMEAIQIVHVFSSRVHDNARSERFPQPYQVHLYTEAGFQKTFGPNSDFVTKPLGGTITLRSKD